MTSLGSRQVITDEPQAKDGHIFLPVDPSVIIAARRDLGELLKSKRTQIGVSQYCLAICLGWTSAQTVSNIERGVATLPIKHVPKMAEVLGLDQRELRKRIAQIKRLGVLSRLPDAED